MQNCDVEVRRIERHCNFVSFSQPAIIVRQNGTPVNECLSNFTQQQRRAFMHARSLQYQTPINTTHQIYELDQKIADEKKKETEKKVCSILYNRVAEIAFPQQDFARAFRDTFQKSPS